MTSQKLQDEIAYFEKQSADYIKSGQALEEAQSRMEEAAVEMEGFEDFCEANAYDHFTAKMFILFSDEEIIANYKHCKETTINEMIRIMRVVIDYRDEQEGVGENGYEEQAAVVEVAAKKSEPSGQVNAMQGDGKSPEQVLAEIMAKRA